MSTEDMAKGLWCDLSVAVERLPTKLGSPHVFRQNSYAFSYEKGAVLSGMAQLELMGWPRSALSRRFKDSELRRLSGECHSLPMCAMVHFCLFCNP